MTRKHFEVMMRIVKDTWAVSDANEAQTVAVAFAALAQQFNPRFDRARFFEACDLIDPYAASRRYVGLDGQERGE